MKKSFNLRLTAQKLKLQGKLHQTYSHTHLQFRVGDESRHIDVDLSKSWLVMGDTSEHRQQIIQIGLPVTLKVIKGINDHIEIELTSKRFAFSDSIVIASSRLDLTPIMEAKDKQLKIFTNLESRESKQVMAILYLEILVESIESELVSGNSLITGVANELHLLGRKNHP